MRTASAPIAATRPAVVRRAPATRRAPTLNNDVAPAPSMRTPVSDVEHLLRLDGLPQLGLLLSAVLRVASSRLAMRGFEVGQEPLRRPRAVPNGRVIALEVPISFNLVAQNSTAGASLPAAKKLLVRAGVMVRVNRLGEWESDLVLWACTPSRAASAWPGLSPFSTRLSLTLSTDQCERDEFRTVGDMRAAMRRLESHIDRGGATLSEVAGDFADNLLAASSPRRAS